MRTAIPFLILAACSAAPAKQDISDAPFDIDSLDSKEDSPTKPSKGIDLRVAELGADTFTGSRGFIAHQIHLVQGRVDIDLSGTEDGAPLDTILYVFGPKKANGKYSKYALAFNDDLEPGVNLGSHIVLDVPADGTYQIVASTYDNYIYYPYRVSRGSYQLIVKCQDPTFGACGPAVSGIDGECWADEDCVAADHETPLHCEGEVTCAPGTQCLFVRMGKCVADYAWMTYAAKQCNNNPWGGESLTTDEETAFEVRDLAQIKKHYNLAFAELGQLTPPDPMAHCLSCNCARGDEIVVKVSTPDAEILAADGWIYSSPDPTAQSIEPKQCGSNPWQTGTSTSTSEELDQVDDYLDAQGAKTVKRGFAYPAEPKPTCSGCNCPRGDRLIAFPVDQQSHGLLSSLGFSDIYVP